MDEFLKLALTALLGGGIGVAVISAIHERWKFKAQRQATKEDRKSEKEDRTNQIEAAVNELKNCDNAKTLDIKRRFLDVEVQIDMLQKQILAQSEAMKLILLDRVLWLGHGYLVKGEISFDDRRRLRAMYECYHDGLGGNGDAHLIMSMIDDLPLKGQSKGANDHENQGE